MGLIAYYRERERQPEHLAAPNTRSPYWRDGSIVVTGRRLSADIGQAAAISGSPASGTTQHGVGPVVATGVVPSVAIGAATQFTLLIALRPSAVNGYQRVFSRSDTLVSMFGNISAGGIDLSIPHSGATGWWDINSGGFVANRDYVIAISYDGTGTSNDPVASVNGRRVSVSRFTAPTGTLSSTAGTLVLGNRADGQRAIGGPLPLFAWIPAAFDQAAIDSLTGNPWQLYEDEVIWVPVSAGGGAVDLAGTGSVDALGSGALTTQALLGAAGSAGFGSSGALSVQAILSGHGRIEAAGIGNLAARAALAGAGRLDALGSGALTTRAVLSGSGLALFAGIGTFTVGGLGAALAGVGLASATGIGSLSTQASLSGAGAVSAQALGTLASRSSLAGSGFASFDGFGSLGVAGLALAGTGVATATAGSGVLTVRAQLVSQAQVSAFGVATLGTRAVLAGVGAFGSAGIGSLMLELPEVYAALTPMRRQRLADGAGVTARRPAQTSTASRRN